ncbi:MAG: AI-2E family transporter [Chlamydiae bacterium]|nr:AI-2E family transporter [Chlamydiota bacterium]MBI3277268.1 AI-2E family transporter [Chlamydiota bacterium]
MNVRRDQLFRFFFLGVFLFLLYQILNILSPFYTGILGSIVLSLIFFPLHRLNLRMVGKKRINLASFVSTFFVVVLIVLPFIFLSWLLLNEIKTLSPMIKQLGITLEKWRQGEISTDVHWLKIIEDKLKSLLDLTQVDFQKMLAETAGKLVNNLYLLGKKLPRNALALVFNVLVMIFTLFFLFRDGPFLFKKAKDLVPMEPKHKDQIADLLYSTLTAVVRGVFIVAAAQGIAAGIGFRIMGIPAFVVLGFTTMFTAMIPFVGAGAVWIPVCICYFIKGATWQWIFLLIWGSGVVSLVDNFLRPILIGHRIKLPMLFLFFGILGGIKVYGPMGLFLGPLVVALAMTFIKIYGEEYQE